MLGTDVYLQDCVEKRDRLCLFFPDAPEGERVVEIHIERDGVSSAPVVLSEAQVAWLKENL